jgi:polyisoprenyl-teichoic acid--peptidoglycan teichoic acid transferase
MLLVKADKSEMNFKKFLLIVTIATSSFLFCAGIFLMNYIDDYKQNPVPGGIIPDEIIKSIQSDNKAFNILFMVKEKSGGNTDTMLLINYDPSGSKLNVISIPRDTYYEVKDANPPKINAAYYYEGPEGAMKAVSNVLNVNIKYFVVIKISAFRQIIDLLGGVDFYVPVDLDYDDPTQNLHIHLEKGMQLLDGDKAEQLLRFRKTQNDKYDAEISKYYDGSDLKREEMQKLFITAFIKQKFSIGYLPQISKAINIVFENIETDLPLKDILELASKAVTIKSDDIKWFQLPGKEKIMDYWFFIPDKTETIKITGEYFTSE